MAFEEPLGNILYESLVYFCLGKQGALETAMDKVIWSLRQKAKGRRWG